MSEDKDLYHPDRRADTVIGDHDLAKIAGMLKQALRTEFNSYTNNVDFNNWLQTEYGVRLIMDIKGLGIESIEIIDEQKYLLFILKYQ